MELGTRTALIATALPVLITDPPLRLSVNTVEPPEATVTLPVLKL
jgi:hypothetical protein